jgi:hypothetical protein
MGRLSKIWSSLCAKNGQARNSANVLANLAKVGSLSDSATLVTDSGSQSSRVSNKAVLFDSKTDQIGDLVGRFREISEISAGDRLSLAGAGGSGSLQKYESDKMSGNELVGAYLRDRPGDPEPFIQQGAALNPAKLVDLAEPETVLAHQWDCTPDSILFDANSPADPGLVEHDRSVLTKCELSSDPEAKCDQPAKSARQSQQSNLLPSAVTGSDELDQATTFDKFSDDSLNLLAANVGTPARILSWLASHHEPEIRALVARNRNALPETVWLLAKDYYQSVRLSIAEDLKADRSILKTLCDDPSALVAWRAKNTLYLLKAGARTGNNFATLTPLTAADSSAKIDLPGHGSQSGALPDEELDFLKIIARSPSTPPRRLSELAKHARKEVRALVAENPNSPLQTLWDLSKDEDSGVKVKVAENYNCPIEIVEALQEDEDSFVSWQARNMLLKLMGQSTEPISLTEEEMRAPLVPSL